MLTDLAVYLQVAQSSTCRSEEIPIPARTLTEAKLSELFSEVEKHCERVEAVLIHPGDLSQGALHRPSGCFALLDGRDPAWGGLLGEETPVDETLWCLWGAVVYFTDKVPKGTATLIGGPVFGPNEGRDQRVLVAHLKGEEETCPEISTWGTRICASS